jgi:hypothetical protein
VVGRVLAHGGFTDSHLYSAARDRTAVGARPGPPAREQTAGTTREASQP